MDAFQKKLPILRAMRPAQWVKNALVAAPLFFAYGDQFQGLSAAKALAPAAATSFLAVISFCLVSSGIYLFNDILDRAEDALHPVKRFRPIASGELSVAAARAASAILLLVGLGLASALGGKFCAIAGIYVAMQFAYTLLLKRVALLDVVVIAIGFVMRAIAGAVAIKVDISPWLVLCTFFISLFLALCKRRQEKVIHAESEQRRSVKGYGVTLLNLLISIAATSTIIAYSLYTVSAETVAKFGTRRLGATIPFVVFGVFRYLYLVFTEKQGERPEQTLLSDTAILITVALYLTAFATVLALR